MRSTLPIKIAKTGYMAISAVLCFFGLLFIIKPDFSSDLLGVFMGIMLICFGAVKLVGFFSKDLYRLAFQYDLAFGILLLLMGIVVLIRPGNVLNFICVMLGVAVLADALFRIQMSLDAKKFGISVWWLILLLAVAAGGIGLALTFRPAASAEILTVLIGVTLLADGVLSLVTVLTAVKIIKHQLPDKALL